MNGAEFKWKHGVYPGMSLKDHDVFFQIRVQGPGPWASFEVKYAADEPVTPCIEFTDFLTRTSPPKRTGTSGYLPERTSPRGPADMWQMRVATYRTIRALGALISGDS